MLESKEELDEFIEYTNNLDIVADQLRQVADDIEEDNPEKSDGNQNTGDTDLDDEDLDSILDHPYGGLFLTTMSIIGQRTDSEVDFIVGNSIMILEDLGEKIVDNIDVIDNRIEKESEEGDLDVEEGFAKVLAKSHFMTDSYVLFFSLAHILIEEYSSKILQENIIEEEYRSTNKTETLLERRLSQEERVQLLLRTGSLENGVISEMSRIRDIRNNIMHDLYGRHNIGETGINKSDFDRTVETIQKLADKL